MSYGQRSWSWYQEHCGRWVETTFGQASAKNLANRAARVCEEGVELAQAEGVTREVALKIVERVYSRPVGEPNQEAAGVIFTLLVWANARGVHLVRLLAHELKRVSKLDPEHFRAKQREKFAAGTDLVPPLP